jgi:multisubunit Na+/H+ antiporter MnhC subunit
MKMTLPPQRPLRQGLLLSAVVIAVTALAAVILWAPLPAARLGYLLRSF